MLRLIAVAALLIVATPLILLGKVGELMHDAANELGEV